MAILLGLLALTSSGLAQEGTTLTVAGEGAVTVPADVVIVSVSITVEDENVTLASLRACEGLNRTIEALIEAGVSRTDVSAGRGRSVSKIQSTSRICDNSSCLSVAGEAVTLVKEEVTIRFDPRNEDLINRSLEAATAQGAEAAISWYALEEKEEAFCEARKKAVEDAEEEARALAAAAGLRLGERLEIYEPSPPTVVQDSGAVDLFDIAMMDLFDLSWPWSLDSFEKESPPEAGMLEVRSMVMVTYRVYS